jgi:hypothetical protein
VEGRSYNALVWDILITPIKSGPAELRFRQDIALQIVNSDSRFPSVFSMSRTRTEPATLLSPELPAEILPLPAEGRPDGFSGAIGQMNVESGVSETDLMVGEPITLTVTLSGKGNFERISPPELPQWDDWRIYPPKVEFTAEDPRGFSGQKSFEYILIPQSEALSEIPGFAVSYFDPVSAIFETRAIAAVPVTVKPSDKPAGSQPFIPAMGGEADSGELVPEDILPLKPSPGNLQPAGKTLWKSTAFWGYQVAVAVLLLAGGIWLRQRNRLRTDKHLARRHAGGRKVRKALLAAQNHARAGDAAAFLEVARFCLQETISHRSPSPVEAKTLVTPDCLAILQANDVDESVQKRVVRILDAADAHQFAGASPDRGEIESLHKELTAVVQELNRTTR